MNLIHNLSQLDRYAHGNIYIIQSQYELLNDELRKELITINEIEAEEERSRIIMLSHRQCPHF